MPFQEGIAQKKARLGMRRALVRKGGRSGLSSATEDDQSAGGEGKEHAARFRDDNAGTGGEVGSDVGGTEFTRPNAEFINRPVHAGVAPAGGTDGLEVGGDI